MLQPGSLGMQRGTAHDLRGYLSLHVYQSRIIALKHLLHLKYCAGSSIKHHSCVQRAHNLVTETTAQSLLWEGIGTIQLLFRGNR